MIMTDAELLTECRKGLPYPVSSEIMDALITQKMQVVKTFMLEAGVPEEKIYSKVAIGALVCGISDIWNLEAGKVKFSDLFIMLVNQLR